WVVGGRGKLDGLVGESRRSSAAEDCCPVTSAADEGGPGSHNGADPAEVDPDGACGCAPDVQAAREGSPAIFDAAAATTGAGPPTRDLKLVVLLQSVDGVYRAKLAVGSDGCDPELCAMDVPDLPTALERLAEVASAAETRWETHQRYPAAASRPTSSRNHVAR